MRKGTLVSKVADPVLHEVLTRDRLKVCGAPDHPIGRQKGVWLVWNSEVFDSMGEVASFGHCAGLGQFPVSAHGGFVPSHVLI